MPKKKNVLSTKTNTASGACTITQTNTAGTAISARKEATGNKPNDLHHLRENETGE
jgi:hypothetical protein